MNLNDFINIANFLGDDMTEEECSKLMDKAKEELSSDELTTLSANVGGDFYTSVRENMAERGMY